MAATRVERIPPKSSPAFRRCDGHDADHVLASLEEHHQPLQNLRCEEIWNDERLPDLDRLLTKYDTDIHLSTLELPNNALTEASGACLANMVKCQQESLFHLDVSHNPLTHAGLVSLMDPLLTQGSKLRILNLTGTQLVGKAASQIAALLRNNPGLHELYVGHNQLGTKGIKVIAPELRSSNLQVLDVSYNNIKMRGVNLLASALSHKLENDQSSSSSFLKVLDITCNNIGPTGLHEFAKFLKLDHTMEAFYCGGNNLGPTGAAHMADILRHNYTLRKLRIADNNLGDAGTSALVEELAENDYRSTTLEYLDLGWNGIGSEGAKSLALALQQNAKLARIDLTGNQICSIGAKALAGSLSYNLSLHELNLHQNAVDNPGALAFALAMAKPSCRLKKLKWEENPIGESGSIALQRIPQLRRNYQYWLGTMLRDVARGTLSMIDMSRNTNIGDEEVTLLADVLGEHNPVIRSFLLRGESLTSRSMVPLVEKSLTEASKIVRLYLKNCSASAAELVAALGESIAANVSLEVLSVTDSALSTDDAKILSQGLALNKQLRRLNLDNNDIRDEGLTNLVSNLLPHATIVSLSLSRNGITDRSMTLDKIQSLKEFQVSNNSITDRGALELFQTLDDDACRLEWLGFQNCQVTKKGGETLKNCLPTTAVVEY